MTRHHDDEPCEVKKEKTVREMLVQNAAEAKEGASRIEKLTHELIVALIGTDIVDGRKEPGEKKTAEDLMNTLTDYMHDTRKMHDETVERLEHLVREFCG